MTGICYTFKTCSSGMEAIGGTVLAVGAVGVGIAVGVATAPAWVLIGSAALVGFGAGFTITSGIMDILDDPERTPRSESPDSTLTPIPFGPDEPLGLGEIPNAVSIGSPPEDVNTDGALKELGDPSVPFSVDMGISELPFGFTPGPGCFIAGTPVVLGDGRRKPIETVEVGDYVVSRDEATGKTSSQRVSRTWIHKVPATCSFT